MDTYCLFRVATASRLALLHIIIYAAAGWYHISKPLCHIMVIMFVLLWGCVGAGDDRSQRTKKGHRAAEGGGGKKGTGLQRFLCFQASVPFLVGANILKARQVSLSSLVLGWGQKGHQALVFFLAGPKVAPILSAI